MSFSFTTLETPGTEGTPQLLFKQPNRALCIGRVLPANRKNGVFPHIDQTFSIGCTTADARTIDGALDAVLLRTQGDIVSGVGIAGGLESFVSNGDANR